MNCPQREPHGKNLRVACRILEENGPSHSQQEKGMPWLQTQGIEFYQPPVCLEEGSEPQMKLQPWLTLWFQPGEPWGQDPAKPYPDFWTTETVRLAAKIEEICNAAMEWFLWFEEIWFWFDLIPLIWGNMASIISP